MINEQQVRQVLLQLLTASRILSSQIWPASTWFWSADRNTSVSRQWAERSSPRAHHAAR